MGRTRIEHAMIEEALISMIRRLDMRQAWALLVLLADPAAVRSLPPSTPGQPVPPLGAQDHLSRESP